MTRGTQLLLATAALLLTACPSDDVTPGDTDATGSSGTGGMSMPPTTMPPTTMPPTTMSSVDSSTTDEPGTSSSSTTDDPDGSSSTTDEPGSSSSTTDEPGSSSSTTDEPGTTTTGDPDMEGFGDCDADPTVCLPDEICFTGGMPVEVSFCGLQGCVDVGDCPGAPPGGDAPTVCADVTADMINECYIDCSGGETCPDGMECFADIACGWPAEPPPPPMGEGFADCNADPMSCLDGETCIVDDTDMPTVGVCGFTFCEIPDDCPDPPPGGDAPVACEELLGNGTGDCFLDCAAGQACPPGMECAFDLLCVWPIL